MLVQREVALEHGLCYTDGALANDSMAKAKGGLVKSGYVPGKPKKSRQGQGAGTKYAASSRNNARKPYRGQGK